jgi:hypothetical protein
MQAEKENNSYELEHAIPKMVLETTQGMHNNRCAGFCFIEQPITLHLSSTLQEHTQGR